MSHPTQQMLDQAAQWFVILASGETTPEEHHDYQAWLAADPLHKKAWQHIQSATQLLNTLPEPARPLAQQTLQRLDKKHSRRQAIAGFIGFAGLIGFSALGWQTYQYTDRAPDFKTAVGERRLVHLPDGSELTLDSQTQVDIQFNEKQRLVILRQGRIFIKTHPNADNNAPTFIVQTRHGHIQPLGTQFSVDQNTDSTQVSVTEKRVQVTNQYNQKLIQSGQTLSFNQQNWLVQRANLLNDQAWLKGLLIANEMPLSEFIKELARYSHQAIHLDAKVQQLTISGTFSLEQTQQTLDTLALTLPVSVKKHNQPLRQQRYWIESTTN